MNEDAESRRKRALESFWMPSVQSMMSRKSSITNAFVNAIIPVIAPSAEEVDEALQILQISPWDLRCAYCGDVATEWDHLRPLVKDRRPTGYISEIANLVPSCGKCNQSKGNKPWELWMRSAAPLSPTGRALPDIEKRIARLKSFERWRVVAPIDFETLLGREVWCEYWMHCERVVDCLRESQAVADALRDRIMGLRRA